LPNVGKSTLFNALTRPVSAAENYPFCTIEPKRRHCRVPDSRLQPLAISPSRKSDSGGGRVRRHRRAGCRRVERRGPWQPVPRQHPRNRRHHQHGALLVDDNVVHVTGRIDPVSDIETIHTELALARSADVEKAPSARARPPRRVTRRRSDSAHCWRRCARNSIRACRCRALRLEKGKSVQLLKPAVSADRRQPADLRMPMSTKHGFVNNLLLRSGTEFSVREKFPVVAICAAPRSRNHGSAE